MPSCLRAIRVFAVTAALAGTIPPVLAQEPAVGYRVLSTSKTSTMQKEMQEAAQAGFRFADVIGGETAMGGSEVLVIMERGADRIAYEYRLLATSKTSTMQKELQEAGALGFAYRGQTQFKSAFGGREVVAILERSTNGDRRGYEYLLLATSKTSTMQKEMTDAAERGFAFVGLTVGKTAMGGDEVVSIMQRQTR